MTDHGRFRPFGSALLILALAAVSRAQDVSAPVLNALQAGDQSRLRTLAERLHPDPWLVACDLCARGHFDAAERFARASRKPDAAKLPARIAAWRKAPPKREFVAALFRVERAARSEDWAVVVRQLQPLDAGRDRFLQAFLAVFGGQALANLRQQECVTPLEEGIDLAEEIGWLAGQRNAVLNLGWFHATSGNFKPALALMRRDLALTRTRGLETGQQLMNLGGAYGSIGDYRAARRFLIDAVEELRRSTYSDNLPYALMNTGLVHVLLGDYGQALTYYEEALDLAKRANNRALIVQVTLGLGTAHTKLGNLDKAQELLARALREAEAIGDLESTARAAGGLGNLHEDRGEYTKALAAMERTIATARKAKNRRMELTARAAGGILHLKMGNAEQARRDLEAVLPALVKDQHTDMVIRGTLRLGQALMKLGRDDDAFDHFWSALEQAQARDAGALVVLIRQVMAEAALDQGKAAKALASAREGAQALWRLVRGLADEQGAMARQKHAELFGIGMRAAVAAKDARALSFFMERGRAGALLESMQGRDALRTALVPQRLRDEEDATLTDLAIARRNYLDAVQTEKRKAITAARVPLDEARKQLRDVQDRIQRALKAGAALVYPETLSLDEIQRHLRRDEAFVQYALLEKEGVALVIEPDAARIVKLGAIDDAVDDHEALRNAIIKPLELGAVKRVLVSPDGALFKVPFVELLGGREVAYVPSGTIYGMLKPEARARGKAILALGAPDYEGRNLAPLPGSRAEARAVGATKVLLGRDATEQAFWTGVGASERWRAVHVACHGIVNDQAPLQSAIALTAREADDGLLTAFEIVRGRIPADLVALSACETGRGRFYRGEGLLGLTRAVLFAGAPRVIVSLWKVDDAATKALMVEFYRLWKTGNPTATALKQAQAFVASNPKWKDPKYWAAWQLWGLPD